MPLAAPHAELALIPNRSWFCLDGATQTSHHGLGTVMADSSATSDTWWPDVFQSLRAASTPGEVFARGRTFTEQLGFSFCSFGLRHLSAFGQEQDAIFDSYPRGWMKHYIARDYIRIDPTVALGAQRDSPVRWSDRVFAEATELWADARSVGLRVGIATPSWGNARYFGLLSVARETTALSEAELTWLRPRLRWIADNMRGCIQVATANERTAKQQVRLSAREREVLTWTAQGKTSWEIGQIIGISENTVNFHIKNTIRKLDAQNKVHAAARAVHLGLLASS
ncbi:MAG: autoinducer binding domain-containing protein [Polyangiales bacterium]